MKGQKQFNNLVIENPQYAINNIENYRHNINYSIQDILTKFVSVIIEYMKFMAEKITMKNKHCYRFTFERGVETLIHVFTIILYYTKNLDLAFYHSQKAYYFYIEFIEQISDDNITFLQLSSRDAISFVYKKTIFEINQDYKKNMVELTNEDKNILSYMDSYIGIYKNMIRYIVLDTGFNCSNNIDHINKYCDNLKTIGDEINKLKIKKTYIECIYLFTNLLVDKQIKLSLFFDLILDFIKRLQFKKKMIDEVYLRKNIFNFIQELDIDDTNNNLIQTIFTE